MKATDNKLFYALRITGWVLCGLLIACTKTPNQRASQALDVASLDAGTLTIENLSGHWVYIDFWASWCPPCLDSFPWMENMHHAYKDHITFITVNEDKNPAKREQFITQTGTELPVIVDENAIVMRRFQIRGLPTALIISPKGDIVHRHEGFFVERQDYYERVLRSAIGLDPDRLTHGVQYD